MMSMLFDTKVFKNFIIFLLLTTTYELLFFKVASNILGRFLYPTFFYFFPSFSIFFQGYLMKINKY